MLYDWFRTRASLIGELTEVREQAVTADRMVQDVAADRDHFAGLHQKEKVAHEATQRLIEVFERDSLGDVFRPTVPRTPEEDLEAMRAHVAALEERVHELQRANMAADRR